ncbi:hypothetical protein C8R47DRAFT_1062906 [Mycena vitilis]|nr:hypothetical protein C8R47DRAFT_1062906 [Mycena vitilis]
MRRHISLQSPRSPCDPAIPYAIQPNRKAVLPPVRRLGAPIAPSLNAAGDCTDCGMGTVKCSERAVAQVRGRKRRGAGVKKVRPVPAAAAVWSGFAPAADIGLTPALWIPQLQTCGHARAAKLRTTLAQMTSKKVLISSHPSPEFGDPEKEFSVVQSSLLQLPNVVGLVFRRFYSRTSRRNSQGEYSGVVYGALRARLNVSTNRLQRTSLRSLNAKSVYVFCFRDSRNYLALKFPPTISYAISPRTQGPIVQANIIGRGVRRLLSNSKAAASTTRGFDSPHPNFQFIQSPDQQKRVRLARLEFLPAQRQLRFFPVTRPVVSPFGRDLHSRITRRNKQEEYSGVVHGAPQARLGGLTKWYLAVRGSTPRVRIIL